MAESHLSLQNDAARRHTRTLSIIRDYTNGVAVQKICERYAMSRTNVLRIARITGLPKRDRLIVSQDARRAIIEAYKSGLPLTEIATHWNVSEAFVCKVAHDAGVPFRRTHRPRWSELREDPKP